MLGDGEDCVVVFGFVDGVEQINMGVCEVCQLIDVKVWLDGKYYEYM